MNRVISTKTNLVLNSVLHNSPKYYTQNSFFWAFRAAYSKRRSPKLIDNLNQPSIPLVQIGFSFHFYMLVGRENPPSNPRLVLSSWCFWQGNSLWCSYKAAQCSFSKGVQKAVIIPHCPTEAVHRQMIASRAELLGGKHFLQRMEKRLWHTTV